MVIVFHRPVNGVAGQSVLGRRLSKSTVARPPSTARTQHLELSRRRQDSGAYNHSYPRLTGSCYLHLPHRTETGLNAEDWSRASFEIERPKALHRITLDSRLVAS